MEEKHGLQQLGKANPCGLNDAPPPHSKGQENVPAMCEGQSTVASKEMTSYPDASVGGGGESQMATPQKKRGRPAKKKIGLS